MNKREHTPSSDARAIAEKILTFVRGIDKSNAVPKVGLELYAIDQIAAELEKFGSEQFSAGSDAHHELCKHPIYCRGCNHCGEEGCCGPHDNCPSGKMLEQAKSDGFNEGLEKAAKIARKHGKECEAIEAPDNAGEAFCIEQEIRSLQRPPIEEGREGK